MHRARERNKENNIVIKNHYISGKQCNIIKIENKNYIEDLNSTNGTFVNGIKVEQKTELKNNDTISLSPKGRVFQVKYLKNDLRDKNLEIGIKDFYSNMK